MFRENIFEFIKEKESGLLIPKNSGLRKYVTGMLPEMGLQRESIDKMAQSNAEQTTITGPQDRVLEIRLVRGEDASLRTEDLNAAGRPTYAFTGDDLFDEYLKQRKMRGEKPTALTVLNTYDWLAQDAMFMRPALCLMAATRLKGKIPDEINVAVNNKYEATSIEFLNSYFGKDRKINIRTYAGGTEETIVERINDLCVEIVYSGKSMEENGLEIREIVRFSDIVLIGEDPNLLGRAIGEDLRQIQDRAANPVQGSYTANMLSDRKRYRDKFASEAMEVFSALESGQNLAGEIADLMYSTGIILQGEKITPRQVARIIYERLK